MLPIIAPPTAIPTEQAEHRAERDRTRAFFDRTALAFHVIERVVLPEYRDTLARLRLPLSFTVLDLGTGTGSLARAFWERGHRAVGVDFSERLLRRARRLTPGVRFDLRDIVDIETLSDRAFDVVAMGYVLHGMPPALRARTLRLAARVAAHYVLVIDHGQHGGWFTRLIEWVEGPHYVEYTSRPLRETLESCGLEVVEQDRTRSGGRSWLCRPEGPYRDRKP